MESNLQTINTARNETLLFTFGSDERYPYQGGYVEIAAPSIQAACTIFQAYYPDRVDGILNCSDYYTAAEFEKPE